MYREHLTQDERDEIIANYGDKMTPPHCNPETFHRPGLCAFCDGYYNVNPGFRPAAYATPEANGWGGNQAPTVDDLKARAEADTQAGFWTAMFDELNQQTHAWRETVRKIKDKFIIGGNDGSEGSTEEG